MGLLLILVIIFVLLEIGFPRQPGPVTEAIGNAIAERSKQAAKEFWYRLYWLMVQKRVRRIWRFCRRHYGWGIEILDSANSYFLLNHTFH